MEDIATIRHSAAHLMANAIKSIWKDAQFAFGPDTENGFYYDVLIPGDTIKEADLEKIEKRMKKLVKANERFEKEIISKDEALELFKDQEFKTLLLGNQLKDERQVSIYRHGDFVDLCKGPHVERAGKIRGFKLYKLAGAYWLGDQNNKQLQRVYGLCYLSEEELEYQLNLIKEAKERDHRLLSTKLKLFSFVDEGPGFPIMLPNGRSIFNTLINFNREENYKRGYQEVSTPQMLDRSLWDRSGHTDYYIENIYFSDVDKKSFAIKPMNCPGSILIYKEQRRSFRDLPLRMSEFGLVHRAELSGVLHGLFRARAFTQDDAHIYCANDDLEQELINIIDHTIDVYKLFGFEKYKVYVSTMPDKAIGDPAIWQRATSILETALKRRSVNFMIKDKEGAFYGPKIEFNVEDSIGRSWQLGTVQLDFFLPERFDISFINSEGEKERPAMIHRAIFGSIERFMGILIEHYKGAFPVWLAPFQVAIIPITDNQNRYANSLKERLIKEKVRVDLDLSSERMQKKIRNKQIMQIPYMLVVGAKEEESDNVSLRLRSGVDLGNMPFDDFLEKFKKVRDSYSLDLLEN